MKRMFERAARRAAPLVGIALALGASGCSSGSRRASTAASEKAEYWLCAKAGGLTMPDGVSVTIWGYVRDTPGFGGGCAGEPTLPGPALSVGEGDATLTIHLRNLLAAPTSIVVPGQSAAMTPVWDDGTSGPRTSPTQRVRSFTHEAPPGGEAVYAWSGIRPGTFLYHSGTRPQVQVQMGLYGALTRNFREARTGADPASAEAYPDVRYDAQAVLVFSEIDPAQHVAIANGTYGTEPGPTSTLRYQPRYFLLNGRPYSSASAALALAAGKATLLRLVNAGLQSYAPLMQGMHMRMIAQDGHPLPWPGNAREQYSTLLASLTTVDALVVPPAPSSAEVQYALYDRRLNLTTGLEPDGGMLARVEVYAP